MEDRKEFVGEGSFSDTVVLNGQEDPAGVIGFGVTKVLNDHHVGDQVVPVPTRAEVDWYVNAFEFRHVGRLNVSIEDAAALMSLGMTARDMLCDWIYSSTEGDSVRPTLNFKCLADRDEATEHRAAYKDTEAAPEPLDQKMVRNIIRDEIWGGEAVRSSIRDIALEEIRRSLRFIGGCEETQEDVARIAKGIVSRDIAGELNNNPVRASLEHWYVRKENERK